MFLRYILYAFLIYLLYKLVFDFLIPVIKTTRQVKKQFQDMQSRMNDFNNQQPPNVNASGSKQDNTSKTTVKKEQPGDYIDFEEVK